MADQLESVVSCPEIDDFSFLDMILSHVTSVLQISGTPPTEPLK